MLLSLLFSFSPLLLVSQKAVAITVFKSKVGLEDYGDAISGAHLITTDNGSLTTDIRNFSICLRFNYLVLGDKAEGKGRLVTISKWRTTEKNSEGDYVYINARYRSSFFGLGLKRTFMLQDPNREDFQIWEANRWNHFCLSFTRDLGLIQFVKDGKLLNIDYNHEELTQVQFPGEILNHIYIGRCAFDHRGSCTGPQGRMTDFNMWKRALTIPEMTDFTMCKKMFKGDLVNWDESGWDLVNITEINNSEEEICISPKPGDVLFPEKRTLESLKSICGRFKGQVSVIKDEESQSEMSDKVAAMKECGSFWNGWADEDEEGIWRDVNGDDYLLKDETFVPWSLGKPNGGRAENCGLVRKGKNVWNDAPCELEYCGFCQLEKAPDLQIRGLCDKTKFDLRYSWTWTYTNDRHAFRGFADSLLSFDSINEVWQLTSYKNSELMAVSDMDDYPFGTYDWTIYNETCYGDEFVGEINVTLSINACNDNEFNCYDGNCVKMNQRCDRVLDCPDKSDETNCDWISLDDAYIKEVTPPPGSNMTTLPVHVNVDLLSILDINEVGSSIKLQFSLKLTWKDSRLTMMNLQDDYHLNTLTPAYKDKIWIPEVAFHNTQSKLKSLNDKEAFITISKNGPFNRNRKSELQNAFTYKGNENPLTILRIYDIDFICEFDIGIVPFDTQNCSIKLVMAGNSGQFVHLEIDEFKYLGPIDLTQYFVKSINTSFIKVENNETALELRVIFGRRLLGTILTTYLPTIIICIVSFSTNYFQAFFFEAVVTVNLTSLLVLTTLFISVSNSLPKTAYIKMMDIWLIVNLFIPFSEVLLHTLIDSLRDKDDREVNHHGSSNQVGAMFTEAKESDLIHRNEKIEVRAREELYKRYKLNALRRKQFNWAHRMASQGLPLMFFLFCIVYFTIGMMYYYR